jgi:hypothetical protein
MPVGVSDMNQSVQKRARLLGWLTARAGPRRLVHRVLALVLLIPMLTAVTASAVRVGADDSEPLLLNVPFYSQRDPRWAGLPVGPEPQDPTTWFGECGCMVTAQAMVASYWLSASSPLTWTRVRDPRYPYSPERSIAEFSFNPAYLDLVMRHRAGRPVNWGYKKPGACNVGLRDGATEQIAVPMTAGRVGGPQLQLSPTGYTVDWGAGASERDIIAALRRGEPVLAVRDEAPGHTLVIVGWDGRYFWVLDPGFYWNEPGLRRLGDWPPWYDGTSAGYWKEMNDLRWIGFTRPVWEPAHYLGFEDDPAPVQALVVSPDGTRSGWDPALGRVVTGDPDTSVVNPPSAQNLLDRKAPQETAAVSVRHPQRGTYRFLVTGTADGQFTGAVVADFVDV